MNLGGAEWLIILVIVLLLFGVGRISRIGGEMGSAIGNFRKGLREAEQNETPEAADEQG